jgi:hypothetical protein
VKSVVGTKKNLTLKSMRKYLTFFLLIAIVLPGLSQKSFFGVNGGINVANQLQVVYSTPQWKSYQLAQSSPKLSFGFFYQREISPNFAARISAAYMGMGYDFRITAPQKVEINYLTLPLTFQYKPSKHLTLSTGPYLSFTLGGTKINGEDITKTYHKNDTGFSFGLEHDIYKNLSAGISYYLGLKNIWLADTSLDQFTNLTYHTKVTNRALQFTLIYKFKKPS